MLRHRPRRETDADRQRADDAHTEGYETTGYAEVLGRPRPPASTGDWDDVWKRHDQRS